MRGNLVLLGLLGAVSLTQSWLLGLTDLCCGGVQAQCRANCNTQVSIQYGEIVVNLLSGQECGSQCSGECGVFPYMAGLRPCSMDVPRARVLRSCLEKVCTLSGVSWW